MKLNRLSPTVTTGPFFRAVRYAPKLKSDSASHIFLLLSFGCVPFMFFCTWPIVCIYTLIPIVRIFPNMSAVEPDICQVPTFLPLAADKMHIVSRDRLFRICVPHNVVLTLDSKLEVAAPF